MRRGGGRGGKTAGKVIRKECRPCQEFGTHEQRNTSKNLQTKLHTFSASTHTSRQKRHPMTLYHVVFFPCISLYLSNSIKTQSFASKKSSLTWWEWVQKGTRLLRGSGWWSWVCWRTHMANLSVLALSPHLSPAASSLAKRDRSLPSKR